MDAVFGEYSEAKPQKNISTYMSAKRYISMLGSGISFWQCLYHLKNEVFRDFAQPLKVILLDSTLLRYVLYDHKRNFRTNKIVIMKHIR